MQNNLLDWLEFVFSARKLLAESQPLEVYDDYAVANQLLQRYLDTGKF